MQLLKTFSLLLAETNNNVDNQRDNVVLLSKFAYLIKRL
jgi:hypothetical protein